eukprot:366566-Chlamydomonas_euryale.AAC.5
MGSAGHEHELGVRSSTRAARACCWRGGAAGMSISLELGQACGRHAHAVGQPGGWQAHELCCLCERLHECCSAAHVRKRLDTFSAHAREAEHIQRTREGS